MSSKHRRGLVVGGICLSASFALLLGCSAADSAESPVDPLDSNQEELRRPGRAPNGGPRHQQGHGHGHGHGHDHHHGPGHGHGHGHDHGGPGSGGSGGSSTGGSGSPAAGTGPSSGGGGGAFNTGGGSTAGTGFGGAGGGGYDPGVCGDGQWGGYEQCDDGNASSGDGCSSECGLEPNYACDYVGQPCQLVVCGDGLQQSYLRSDGYYAYENCDDGNTVPGDGCNAACEVESGWICEQPGSACREPECGDGRQDSWFVPGPGGGFGGSGSAGGSGGSGGSGGGGTYYYEACDDGNVVSGDGCADSCTIEAGWICSEPNTACRQPVCGDGFVDFIATPGGSGGSGAGGTGSSSGGTGGSGGSGGGIDGYYEGCDDGGTVSGDGCDASCAVESGWACPYWDGSPCHVIVCGDGWADWPDEDCDDANNTSNDGCTDCRYDGGYGGSSSGGSGGGSAGGFTGGFGGTG